MRKFLIVLLSLISLSLSATTYFISTTGSDATGNGTSENPWKSLYHACNSVTTSGNIIHINAGTYIETSQCNLSAGVSIEGVGVTSLIKSHYVAGGGLTNAFIMLSGGTNTSQHISGIKLDGDNLTGNKAIVVYNRSNVSINNCTIVDFLTQGVRFGGSSNSTGNSCYNNIISNCGGFDNDEHSNLSIGYNTGILVYDNIITQNQRAPNHNGLCIQGEDYLYGAKIYNNKIYGLDPEGHQINWTFALEFWNSTKQCGFGMEIYGNTIVGQMDFGAGVTKGTYDYGVDIHHNTFGDDSIYAIDDSKCSLQFEEIVSDVIVRDNLFKNQERCIYMCANGTAGAFDNMKFYNNIFQNVVFGYTAQQTSKGFSGHGCGIIFGGGKTTYVRNIYIWNNTFIAYPGRPAEVGIFLPTVGDVDNINVQNNIFQGFKIAPMSAEAHKYSGSSLTTLVIQKNLYYNNAANNLVTVGFTPTDLTNDNGFIGNPNFISSTDFHLQTSSPAIGRGISLGLDTDYDGVTWKNPPSIGAFEYVGEDNPPSIMNQSFYIAQNIPNGTFVGTIEAYDPDASQTIVYSIISGNNSDAFTIDSSTGVLSVADSTALIVDFELVIQVQDNSISELSSQASITIIIIPTGTKLEGNVKKINIYPNPVFDELIIETDQNFDRLSFEILNSMGQIVFIGKLSEKTIVQTTDFSPGAYLIKLQDGKFSEFKKFLKI